MEFRFSKAFFQAKAGFEPRFHFFLLHHGCTPQRVSQPANFSAFAYRHEHKKVSFHRHASHRYLIF